nr:MAG TPA: intron associated endonuclease [Caudoviricetes sp.]
MKPIGYIYLTTCLVNNKIYIGKHELNGQKNYIGSGTLFKRAVKKYGKENFKKKILRLCFSLHELRIWEHFYIVKYKSTDINIGYNIAKGDVNSTEYNPAKLPEVRERISNMKKGKPSTFKGKKHSEESKLKLSISVKKRFEDEEQRRHLRKMTLLQFKTKGNPMKGKKQSKESKLKNRISHLSKIPWNKGKPWNKETIEKIKKSKQNISEEIKNKIRQSRIGKKASEETKKKMSEKRCMRESPSKGKKWTKEQRERLSEIRKKYRHDEDTKKLLSKLNKGSNNPNYGKRYITNEIVNKLIMKDESLPEGWRYGCKQNHGSKK